MPTHLISDLHIDDGSGPFTTSGGAKAFNDFLDMVGNDPLVGVGDILDLWAWTLPSIMFGPNGRIVHRLEDHPNFTYILGNHDLKPHIIAGLFPEIKVKMSLQLGDYTVFHGHQVDPKLNTAWKRWTVEEGDKLIHELDNPELNCIGQWFAAGDRTNAPLIQALQDSGKNFILGHSHISLDQRLRGGGWYINLGCWCGDPDERCYATVDDNGKVELHQWE